MAKKKTDVCLAGAPAINGVCGDANCVCAGSKEYTVTWTIEVYARSPLEAADEAKRIQLDPMSIANVFLVKEFHGPKPAVRVDLDEEVSDG